MCSYVCFYFYIIWTCLGIQCGHQRKNFILQENLPFLTVHMTINALNLESTVVQYDNLPDYDFYYAVHYSKWMHGC